MNGNEIHYLTGDATLPNVPGPKILVHVCNDIGKWGKGFVLAISRRWPEPEATFKRCFKAGECSALGDVQFVQVAGDLTVANLIGQHKIATPKTPGYVPVRYPAIEQGLATVAERAVLQGASVHMPRIGCGLAGGKWEMIEPLLQKTLLAQRVAVYVYDFG